MTTFFIAGAQRSGTTLLSVLLSKHPDIHIDGNSIAFRLVSCLLTNFNIVLPYNMHHESKKILSWLIKEDYKGRLSDILDYDNIDNYKNSKELIKKSLVRLTQNKNKTVFGDKSPGIEHFVPELLTLLPEAKFIHIVRDGRAVASSQYERSHKNIQLGAQDWVDSSVLALQNVQTLGEEQYKIVKYEDLVNSPKKILSSVCEFLELEFSNKMIFNEQEKENNNAYVENKMNTEKLVAYTKSLSNKQIRRIEKIQAPILERFGYEIFNTKTKEKYKQLSTFKRIRLNQIDNVKQLFISKRKGMRNRKNIDIHVPLSIRIKTFLFWFGRDLLPKPIFSRVFRKRWVKNIYFDEVN